MTEVRVQSLGLDRTTNTPVVILQEASGERVLPIWIGPGEASAIAMELAGMKFARPLTHDLFSTLITGMGGELKRVLITKVVENTYYAEMIIQRGSEFISVDARPSDSIAIALKTSAQIFTSDELLDVVSIETGDIEDLEQDSAQFGLGQPGSEEEAETEEKKRELKADDLKEYLRRLNPEDFGRFTP